VSMSLPHPVRAVIVVAAALGALALSAGPASADPKDLDLSDAFPCRHLDSSHAERWFCPLTQNNVPVYATPSANAERIGWLRVRGPVDNPKNWFLYQIKAELYSPPGKTAANHWWGFTQADKAGRKPGSDGWGYVSETYFKGGGNLEPDGLLPERTPSACGKDGQLC
jgi:hypothetical protein